MNIFLTGATGFIGSHFLQSAVQAGHHVTALKRNSSNLASVIERPQINWLLGDLSTVTKDDFLGVDVLVHLASIGVSPKVASFDELLQVNVVQSAKLFELAAQSGVPRFVTLGTSHEYGTTSDYYDFIPPNAPLAPVNEYGSVKAASFYLLENIAKKHKVEFFYGRLFSAFGPGQSEQNFWPSLRKAAIMGQDFKMTDGTQVTDFIAVQSVVTHLLCACSRLDINKSTPLIVNVGSGQPQSLLSFAQAQWISLKAPGQILPGSIMTRPGQIKRCVPDLQGLLYPPNSLNS